MSASICPEKKKKKMIQMMYLVYTAMLALNVSAEVVEGFKTVGNAMTKSNENMVTKLDDTYNNFEAALKNNPAKVKEKYDKAQEIKKLSNELVYTIDTVTYSFIGTGKGLTMSTVTYVTFNAHFIISEIERRYKVTLRKDTDASQPGDTMYAGQATIGGRTIGIVAHCTSASVTVIYKNPD